MDSKFLFGIETYSNEKDDLYDKDLHYENELKKNIKEEAEYSRTLLSHINNQLSNINIDEIKDSFLFKKNAILVEYLNNVCAFQLLKNSCDHNVKMEIMKRMNNLKCILDRLSPLESRLNTYIKDASKKKMNSDQKLNKKSLLQDSHTTKYDYSHENLRPNLNVLTENDNTIETNNLQPNLFNLAPSCGSFNNNSIVESCDNNDMIDINESNKNTSIPIKNKESSVFVPSKSRYMPYDDTKMTTISSRKRKDIEDEQRHMTELQKSIVDDLLNLDNETPITYGMKEANNAGYFEKNNPLSKSSSKKDIQMIKDRRLVLMMNDDNGFSDISMEKLAENVSSKLNSKKHKTKLAKRRALRARFRKKMFKRH